MTDTQIKSVGKSATIWIVSCASVVWILICGWLFWISAPCSDVSSNFLASKVSCLASNEIGDALAGAFAPLAFLLLIAAIFLQREDLAIQRQDLLESREVAKEQVEEARRNVAFIEQQTELMKSQRKLEDERRADEKVDGQIRIANATFDRAANILVVTHGGKVIGFRSNLDSVTEPSLKLRLHIESYLELTRLADGLDGNNFPVTFRNEELIDLIAEDVKALHLAATGASSHQKALVAQMGVREARIASQHLQKLAHRASDLSDHIPNDFPN